MKKYFIKHRITISYTLFFLSFVLTFLLLFNGKRIFGVSLVNRLQVLTFFEMMFPSLTVRFFFPSQRRKLLALISEREKNILLNWFVIVPTAFIFACLIKLIPEVADRQNYPVLYFLSILIYAIPCGIAYAYYNIGRNAVIKEIFSSSTKK